MPGLVDALRTFAARITENFATNVAAQPEDQLKAPIQDLLRTAGTLFGIAVVPRTEAQVADLQGRPDIGVAVGGLLRGFIELKAPGLGADPERLRGEQNKRQWDKFKSLPNLIYTDAILGRSTASASAPPRPFALLGMLPRTERKRLTMASRNVSRRSCTASYPGNR